MKINTSFKSIWPSFIPIIILVLVALNQLYLVNLNQLSRWKGGGFGMFSTISERFIHIHLINNQQIDCSEHPKDFSNSLLKLKIYPDYKKIEKLTKQLTTFTWVYKQKKVLGRIEKSVEMVGRSDTLTKTSKIAAFEAIDLEVYKITFNNQTGIVKPKLIRQLRHKK
jgi:hypothetical protein